MTVNRCACTHPSTRAAGGPGGRGDGSRAAVSSTEPPNLPSRPPEQQPFTEGTWVKDTRSIPTTPRLRPPKSLTDPEAHARRPGSLTMGATAKVVLAIATLEGGLVLKILYKAGRRCAPGSHLICRAAAAPPRPTQLPRPPPSPPATPQCSARASEDRAKPLEPSRAERPWRLT